MLFRILKPALSALLQIALVALALVWLLDSGARQWDIVGNGSVCPIT
ncbi:hypothetical protein JCM19235_5462 [Vibrio maritimus]|uniref:Uncharacterized protein n=1 Tax=Vibrio maritimus TaxID=990268 RepID=A0A090RQU4_9VIBR|nr:hypothetical protein JCM19235_5462 [Vibrio maritimus]